MKKIYLLLVLTMLCSSAVFSQQKRANLRVPATSAKYQVDMQAAAKTPSTDEIVSEQPAGTLKYYLRTGRSMIGEWGEVYDFEQNGSAAKVVFADDGESVWFYCPLSSITYPVWVKGTLGADGKTITIPAGALILYGVTEPDPWEDYEGGEVFGLRLHILEMQDNGDGTYTYGIAEGDPDIVWTLDESTGELRLASTDVDAYNVMGVVYDSPESPEDDGQWNGYADYATVYVPFTDKPQTVPEGLTTQEYSMLYEYNDGWNPTQVKGKLVQVGFDGNDVYVTKFSADYPDTWIKGTLSDGKISFPRQMLLINEYNDVVYFNAYTSEEIVEDWGSYFTNELSYDDVVFTYDAETRSFSTEMNCNINPSATSFSGQEMFEKPAFAVFEDKAATPADPAITYFDGWEDEKGFTYFADLSIPVTDTEGNFINPNKLSFRFLTSEDDVYSFTRENYIRTEETDYWEYTPAWEDGMTEIPYTYTDEAGDFSSERAYFRGGELERIGVQSIYRGGGEVRRSNIFFYDEGIVVGVNTPQSATAQKAESTLFDLTGRTATAGAKGLYVERLRMADGTVTARKVVRR